MSNAILATGQNIDDATITGEGQFGDGAGVTKLQTMQVAEAARWTALATIAAIADLGSAKAIDLIALLAHNGSSSATWRIRGATSEANLTASPGYDSGSISMWPATGRPSGYSGKKLSSIKYLSSAETFRWWRIDVIDSSNSDGYFEAGRLYLDQAWQPSVNIEYDWSVGFVDPSPQMETLGGQSYPTEIPSYRKGRFTLGFMDEDELYNNAYEIDRKRGSKKDVLFVRDPAATTHLHRQMIYGLSEGLQPIINPAFNIFSKAYEIRELVP